LHIRPATVTVRAVTHKDNTEDDLVFGAQQGAPAPEINEDKTRQIGDFTVYMFYASAVGKWAMIVFLLYQLGWAFFSTFPLVWLNWWSERPGQNDAIYLAVYALFQTLALVFLGLFAIQTLTTMAVKAGTQLHLALLRAVMGAPMSFFDKTDTGITTNRFSQDIQLIDGDLPDSLLDAVSAALVAVVQAILIAIASPFTACAYPALIGILYMVQKFYLKTSRQLRLLDLEAKSPL
jgi:ABC-type multidrug transport system fused ATPase/permease subunit